MDAMGMVNDFLATLVDRLPGIAMAIGILIVGWIIAVVVRAIVRKGLGLARLNKLVQDNTENKLDLEGGIARGAYYVILVLALIMFFDALNLSQVSATLQGFVDEVFGYLPNLIGAAALAVVGWILATVVRRGSTLALSKTKIDERLQQSAGMKPMSKSVGDILYGLVLLLFLPMVLSTLQLNGLLDPVRNMIDEMLSALPNIFAAGLLGLFGWYLANLLRNLVVNLLGTTGVDKIGERAGLKGTMPLSKLLGLLVFIFVFVPTVIAALNELEIEAIAVPATSMLNEMMAAIPNIFSAAIILAVAYFVSGFVSDIISKLLGGLGFDAVPEKLGFKALPESTSPSRFVGRVIVFFVMLFAVVEAANVLGFHQVSEIVAMMIGFGGQVLLGIVIISVGLWIANLAHAAMSRQAGQNAAFYAGIARIAILGVVFAMGLGAMEVAPRIVEAAFILTLGAVAVAIALSFGLGGREAAGKQMEHWLSRLRGQG